MSIPAAVPPATKTCKDVRETNTADGPEYAVVGAADFTGVDQPLMVGSELA